MPNHVKNRITLSGDKQKIAELIANLSTHFPEKISTTFDDRHNYINEKGEYGRWHPQKKEFTIDKDENNVLKEIPKNFNPLMDEAWTLFPDFDKIIKRPEELNITSDGWISLLENQFSWDETLKHRLDECRKRDNFTYDKSVEESIDNLSQGIKNYLKYGFACWYDWNIENWGTKWNAYDCEKISDNVFQFDTAWSGIPKLIEKMSLIMPEIKIEYEWSDEDTGSNCGSFIMQNGIKQENFIPDSQSKGAYELAFKLRPECEEYYKLIDDNYVYVDEED